MRYEEESKLETGVDELIATMEKMLLSYRDNQGMQGEFMLEQAMGNFQIIVDVLLPDKILISVKEKDEPRPGIFKLFMTYQRSDDWGILETIQVMDERAILLNAAKYQECTEQILCDGLSATDIEKLQKLLDKIRNLDSFPKEVPQTITVMRKFRNMITKLLEEENEGT